MAEALWLFSYGTLQLASVQVALFGREIAGEPDALPGFIVDRIKIADPDVVAASGIEVHKILRRANAAVKPIAGVALAIRADDLPAVDAYEGANYVRILVTLSSGRHAFVYVEPEAG